MAINLNSLVNDIFAIVEQTFEEQIIFVFILRSVPEYYEPGSGDDPVFGSGSDAFRAIRKAVTATRKKLPEYESDMVDILLPLQDLELACQLGDIIEADINYKVVRSDIDPARVVQTVLCKPV